MNHKSIYDRLCSNAKSQNRIKGKGVYYESHHIMPECMGGDGLVSQYKWHSNIVLLTDKEHFLAHRLLCKIYPDNNDLRFAWWAMCNQEAPNQKRVFRPSARAYSEAKNLFIESFSGPNHPLYGKGYLQAGEKNPAYGKPQSEELRARKRVASTKAWSDPKKREEQSKRSLGIKRSDATKEKMSKPKSEEHKRKLKIARNNRGPFSEETKLKISLNNSNRVKYECPSCGRIIGGIGNFNKHQKAHDKIMEIENLINKYFFVSDFKKNHPELHKFIMNNQLQKKYFNNLQNDAKVILLNIDSGVFYFGYEEAISSCSLTMSPYNLMKMINDYKENTTPLIKV